MNDPGINKSDYSLSGWIENLGVVPLLLFSALRFLPIFFLRLARFVLVIRVFETILSLRIRSYLQIRSCNVLLIALVVKGFGHMSHAYAAESNTPKSLRIHPKLEETTLTMSIGEIKTLKIAAGEHYSIGNKQILSAKHQIKKSQLIIRAKHQGYTEIAFWNKQKKVKSYRLYIMDKRSYLKQATIAHSLEASGLKATLQGPYIHVTGQIFKLDQYQSVVKIFRQNKEQIFLNIKVDPLLLKSILSKIYLKTYAQNFKYISCRIQDYLLVCSVDKHDFKANKVLIQLFQQLYLIKFLPKESTLYNIKAKLKIINIENQEGMEVSLGFNKIQGLVNDLFYSTIDKIIAKNSWYFNERKLDIQSLAQPELILVPNQESLIQLGSDIPYQTGNEDKQALRWKFAGLQVKLMIRPIGNQFLVSYQSELSGPDQQNVSGSKGQSKIIMNLDHPQEIFQISYEASAIEETALPYISQIPLLGLLFKGKDNQKTYKNIRAYLLLEREDY